MINSVSDFFWYFKCKKFRQAARVKSYTFWLVKGTINAYKAHMVIRTISGLALVLASAQIWAFPGGLWAFKSSCNTIRSHNAYADVIERTKTSPSDNSALLPEQIELIQMATARNWKPARLKAALRNNGRIFCPWLVEKGLGNDALVSKVSLTRNSKNETVAPVAAFIAGTDVTVFTSTHVFRDPSNGRLMDPERLNECVFQNFDIPRPQQTKLVARPGTFTLREGKGNDLAIIRLANRLPGANGFKVDREGKKNVLTNSKPYLHMSMATESKDGTKMSSDTPVSQVCNKGVGGYRQSPFGNTAGVLIVGGCPFFPGNSGSVLAQEDEESDDLYAAAVVTNKARPEDFNAETNTGSAAAISPNVIAEMDSISGRRPKTASVSVSP